MISNTKNAIRIESQNRISGGARRVYVFLCSHPGCSSEIKCRIDSLKSASGKCKVHSHVKRPFESIFNSLLNDHRKIEVILTYDQFLEFTNIKECHYCMEKIPWLEYGTVSGNFKSRAYFLDRKDHVLGYSKENCVVCCTRCNRCRSDKFTYEEWYGMTKFLRDRKIVCGV